MTAETSTAAVEVVAASKWYGNVVAVNDISFELRPGITGLLGPNGAGKTTLLNMMAGFLRPSAGEVRLLGKPAWHNVGMYADVGLVPEREAIYPFLDGYEFVLLRARLHGLPDPHAATRRALRAVEMTDAENRRTGGYSKGMKQRVKIAASIVHDPKILLLDEPFNGADPRQRLQMMEMLQEMAAQGRTILFSSHILEEMERLGENVLVIVAGRLAASGDYREIRRLMTDRPHTFTLRTSDDRRFAVALVADESVFGLELGGQGLTVQTGAFSSFITAAPRIAKDQGISILEFVPQDESLESVFEYLVSR
jgi:ABC-2 type transport system ATP-binding protein